MKRTLIFAVFLLAFATPKHLRESVPRYEDVTFDEEYFTEDITNNIKDVTIELLHNVLSGEELNREEEEFLEELDLDDAYECKIEQAIANIEEDKGEIIEAIEKVSDEILADEIDNEEHHEELSIDSEFEEVHR